MVQRKGIRRPKKAVNWETNVKDLSFENPTLSKEEDIPFSTIRPTLIRHKITTHQVIKFLAPNRFQSGSVIVKKRSEPSPLWSPLQAMANFYPCIAIYAANILICPSSRLPHL